MFENYGIYINPNGGEQKKLKCPSCGPERKNKADRSLSVNVKEGIWHCHHCGWKGAIKDKASKNEMYEFKKHIFAKAKRKIDS